MFYFLQTPGLLWLTEQSFASTKKKAGAGEGGREEGGKGWHRSAENKSAVGM